MSNKVLIIVAILLGLVVVVLVNRKFAELEKKAAPSTTVFYKARVDIEPGITVREAGGEGFLERITGVPKVFARHLPEAIDGAEYSDWARSRQIERRMEAGEFLMIRHLEPVTGDEVMVAIPEGHIAFSFTVTNTGAVSYLVSPGDVVDVYRIMEVPAPAEEGGSQLKAVRVAEDLRIFAVDSKVAVGGGQVADRGSAYRTVTVTGPPKQIEELMVQASTGPLQLVLKSSTPGG